MLLFLLLFISFFLSLFGQFNPFGDANFGDTKMMPPQELMAPSESFAAPSFPTESKYADSDEPDSGNWYEKLKWWKEAKRVYTVDIHDAIEQLKGIAEEYEKKKKLVAGQLDTYYKSIPADRNAAPGIITTLIDEIKKELEPFEEPTTDEQKKQAALYQEQIKTLDGLKLQFEQFNELIWRMDEALNEVFPQQVRNAEKYDERALDNFERIENVLDDEKAQNYFNIIENSLDNIRDISTYLIGPLQIFIDQVWGKIQILMPQIKKTVEDLAKQDIQVRILTEKEKAERDELLKKREEARLKAAAEKKAAEERKKMSWWQKLFASIGSFFSCIFSSIKNGFSWLGGLFSAGKPAKPVPAKKPEVPKPVAH